MIPLICSAADAAPVAVLIGPQMNDITAPAALSIASVTWRVSSRSRVPEQIGGGGRERRDRGAGESGRAERHFHDLILQSVQRQRQVRQRQRDERKEEEEERGQSRSSRERACVCSLVLAFAQARRPLRCGVGGERRGGREGEN